MTVLTAEDIGGKHRYIAKNRPQWSSSMERIRREGGPWPCPLGHASLLLWRCSVCGKDLVNTRTRSRRADLTA